MQILGIDVGGSGIKGAPVDTETGQLVAERVRIKTPKSAEPEPMAQIVKQIAGFFNWNGPIGIGFPAPIKGGDEIWCGTRSTRDCHHGHARNWNWLCHFLWRGSSAEHRIWSRPAQRHGC